MPIEVSFDTPYPLPSESHDGDLPLDSDSSRDALSSLDSSAPLLSLLDDPDLPSALSSLSRGNTELLTAHYPLQSALPITVTHFWSTHEATHSELLGTSFERPRYGNRRDKMFLQSSKIARDGKFTWIAGSTNDLVWQMRIASATRNWMQNDYIEFCRLLQAKKTGAVNVAATPAAPTQDITIEPSMERPEEGQGLLKRMDSEFVWHRDLMSRLAKSMRMSRHGAYLEPTVRLPLPQKDLTKYRQPLWIVFPFLNVDSVFRSNDLNAAQEILGDITSHPDVAPATGYFPPVDPLPPGPELSLKRSYDDSDLFPRRFKTPVIDGLPTMVMGRQSLYRFFLPDYEGEGTVEQQHLAVLDGREQLMVDQWWILMPDENCVTTLCTADDQATLHLSLRVRHPLLLALDIIRQYTQDSTNDSFDFDRVMEYYDGMILDIGLEQHREFQKIQLIQNIEARRIMRLNRILDEMKMINHVLSQQSMVVDKLAEAIPLFDWETGRMVGTEPPDGKPVLLFDNKRIGKLGHEDAGRIVKEVRNNIARHKEQVSRIIDSAKSARDIEFQLLTLKQANTNFHESRVVTVFTVITIIFLPLSFVTSFFGMNVKEIAGPDNPHTLRYFWLCAGTSSAIVVLLSLLVAFNRKTRQTFDRWTGPIRNRSIWGRGRRKRYGGVWENSEKASLKNKEHMA